MNESTVIVNPTYDILNDISLEVLIKIGTIR